MAVSDSPKIYAGMLKKELLEVADKLGLTGVRKLRKAELMDHIHEALKRPKASKASRSVEMTAKTTLKAGKDSSKAAKTPNLAKTERPKTKTTPAARAKSKAKAEKNAGAASKSSSKTKRAEAKKQERVAEVKRERPESDGVLSEQSRVTAVKYGAVIPFSSESLRDVDAHLPALPDGYGRDRVVLLPRDPDWLYCYWDVRHETKAEARGRGGVNLALRLFEVHGEELEPMAEHWIQDYTNSWYVRAPSPGHAYVVELGYRDGSGAWLTMLRSNNAEVPPAGPSTVIADRFVTIRPNQPLPRTKRGRGGGSKALAAELAATKAELAAAEGGSGEDGGHEAAYRESIGAEGMVAPGSMTGSGAHFAGSPSSGAPWAGSPTLQSAAEGEGEEQGRDFWLVADAELVVFGATDPGATVTLGGQKIRLRRDGSFSVRMAFPNGQIEIPIEAVAADGEQRRGLEMRFVRETSRED